MPRETFDLAGGPERRPCGWLPLLAALAALLMLAGCPPEDAGLSESAEEQASGTFLAAANKVYDDQRPFDLTWEVTYQAKKDSFDPSINVSNRELTISRCNGCHEECGFNRAFDMEHFGTVEWNPYYKGDQWAGVVKRMSQKGSSFMNELLAERIYTYLKEETLGIYDESADPKGALTIAVENQETVKEMITPTAQPISSADAGF
jgi:hypothetical protein